MFDKLRQSIQKTLKHEGSSQDRDWLDTLAGMTDLDALIVVKDQLSKVDFFYPEELKAKIELVIAVDESAYGKVKRVTHNYLTRLNKNKSLKSDTHIVMLEYQRQLYASYSQILDAYKAQNNVKLSPEEINFLLARYLNAAFMLLKWHYFEDQPAPFGIWDNVHKIIKIAEDLAVLNKNFFLYNFQIKETSLATILKRGFMVDTLDKGNYSQLEIELTDRVLKIWSTNPLIVNTFKPNRYHFFIQLEAGKGPERLRVEERFSNCRYWKTTRLVDLMEAYLCAVDMHKPLNEFGLGGVARTAVIAALFKKLRKDWCVDGYSRQRRSEKRNQKNNLINVRHGVEDIHHKLMSIHVQQKEKQTEDSFTFELNMGEEDGSQAISNKKPPSMLGSENLWMVDESTSGFSVDLGQEVADWAEVGALVGYAEIGYTNAFNIAEIKSIRKLADESYRAGFMKISYNVAAVQVSLLENQSISQPSDGQNDSDVFPGLLIDNDATHMPKVLMSVEHFMRGLSYNLNVDGDNHLVTAGKVINRQQGWVLFEALL